MRKRSIDGRRRIRRGGATLIVRIVTMLSLVARTMETKPTANREKGTVMIARQRRRCRVRAKNAHKWTSATTRVPIGSRWRPAQARVESTPD